MLHRLATRLATTFRRRAEAAERRIHYTRRITQRFDDLARAIDSSDLSPAAKIAAIQDLHRSARSALHHLRTFRYIKAAPTLYARPQLPALESAR